MSENKTFEYGQTVRDFTTGFTGVVVGKCEYMDGYKRIGVCSKSTEHAQGNCEWVPPFYLELVDSENLTFEQQPNQTKETITSQISVLTHLLKPQLEYGGISNPNVIETQKKISELLSKL
jgi:hypothetical protein